MCWQLALTVIPHHWSFLTCPLLTSVLCHHPLSQQQNSGRNACSLFRELLGYSVQFFRQNVDNISLNLVLRFSFSSGSLPFMQFSDLTHEQAVRPLWVILLYLKQRHTQKPHLRPMTWDMTIWHWSGWLYVWDLSVPLSIYRLAFSTFSLCFERALCTSCLYV